MLKERWVVACRFRGASVGRERSRDEKRVFGDNRARVLTGWGQVTAAAVP